MGANGRDPVFKKSDPLNRIRVEIVVPDHRVQQRSKPERRDRVRIAASAAHLKWHPRRLAKSLMRARKAQPIVEIRNHERTVMGRNIELLVVEQY